MKACNKSTTEVRSVSYECMKRWDAIMYHRGDKMQDWKKYEKNRTEKDEHTVIRIRKTTREEVLDPLKTEKKDTYDNVIVRELSDKAKKASKKR